MKNKLFSLIFFIFCASQLMFGMDMKKQKITMTLYSKINSSGFPDESMIEIGNKRATQFSFPVINSLMECVVLQGVNYEEPTLQTVNDSLNAPDFMDFFRKNYPIFYSEIGPIASNEKITILELIKKLYSDHYKCPMIELIIVSASHLKELLQNGQRNFTTDNFEITFGGSGPGKDIYNELLYRRDNFKNNPSNIIINQ